MAIRSAPYPASVAAPGRNAADHTQNPGKTTRPADAKSPAAGPVTPSPADPSRVARYQRVDDPALGHSKLLPHAPPGSWAKSLGAMNATNVAVL
jgi:hypothetical protein